MRYSMTITEEMVENGPEWQAGLEPLLADAIDAFCTAVVGKVSAAITKSIPAPYGIDCTLQQRTLYGLQFEDDYLDWAEERVKDLLKQAEANVEGTQHTLKVSWTFEVDLAGVELAMSDLQNFFVNKRHIPYRADSGLAFWEWYGVTQTGLANDTYTSAALADSDVLYVTEQLQLKELPTPLADSLKIQRQVLARPLYQFKEMIWKPREEPSKEEIEVFRKEYNSAVHLALNGPDRRVLWICKDHDTAERQWRNVIVAYNKESSWYNLSHTIGFPNGSHIAFVNAGSSVIPQYAGAKCYCFYDSDATSPYLTPAEYLKAESLYDQMKKETVRFYPDLSDEEEGEEEERTGDIPERYSVPLSVFQSGWCKRCIWLCSTHKQAKAAYMFWRELNMAVSKNDLHLSLEFLNGSGVRFVGLDQTEILRGYEIDYLFAENIQTNTEAWNELQWRMRYTGGKVVTIPEEEAPAQPGFAPNACITMNEAIKVSDEDMEKASKKLCEALGSFRQEYAVTWAGPPPPFPGPSKSTIDPDKEETTKTEPLVNVRELRSVFGWLREDKACALGPYEIIPTDLGTFHILFWGGMDYCASDIDDLKAYAKKVEDQAWEDGERNPFPLDEEVWEWSNGK